MPGDSFSDVVIVDVTSVGIQGPPGPVGPIGPAGPTGTTGLTPITATGSTTPRALQDRFAEVVNVKDWGAVGDGVTDDAAAINAAVTYIRNVVIPGQSALITSGGGFKLVFPYGVYLVRSSLNFTTLYPYTGGGIIDGQGSTIYGKISNAPIVDALGARWLCFQNIGIYGDQTVQPNIGLQLGLIASASSDYNALYNVKINGYFQFTAFYNFASEMCNSYNCEFRNASTTANAFCMVLDALNHWNARSAFVTQNAPLETSQSFNSLSFVSCKWQASGGPAMWISGIRLASFISCYVSNLVTVSNPASTCVVFYQPAVGSYGAYFSRFEIHTEGTGLAYSYWFTGPGGGGCLLVGCSFTDHSAHGSVSVFGLDPAMVSVNLRSCTFDIGSSSPLFDNPTKWFVQARSAYLGVGMFQSSTANWSGKVENQTYPGYVIIPQTVTRVAATGGSFTIGWGTEWLKLTPATPISTYSLTMPLGPGTDAAYDGSAVEISTTQTIATLTLVGNTGQFVGQQPGTMQANTSIKYRYDAATATWQSIGTRTDVATQSRVISAVTVAAVVANAVSVPAGTNYIVVNDSANAVNTLTVGSGTMPDGYDLWLSFPNGGTFAGQVVAPHGNLTLKLLGGGWSILSKFG